MNARKSIAYHALLVCLFVLSDLADSVAARDDALKIGDEIDALVERRKAIEAAENSR